MPIETNEQLIMEYLDIAENDSENIERFARILTDDCVWTLMPPGIAVEGHEDVKRFCSLAMGSRKHGNAAKVRIANWFSDKDRFCVEYFHAAIVGAFRVVENVCLVCQMRDGKFSLVNEYVDASGSFLIRAGLRLLPLILRARKIRFCKSLGKGDGENA